MIDGVVFTGMAIEELEEAIEKEKSISSKLKDWPDVDETYEDDK